jgi:hypothetical protein
MKYTFQRKADAFRHNTVMLFSSIPVGAFSFRICRAAWIAMHCAVVPMVALVLAQQAAAAPCATRTVTPPNAQSLTLSTASYFGLSTSADEAIYATEFAPDCTLLVAGRTTASGAFVDVASPGDPLANIASGTTGSVARLSTDGTALIARSVFGAQVNDIAVSQVSGDVAVASDIALAVVASDLRTLRWSITGGANRVSMTSDGRVAALFGKTLRAYSASGVQLFQIAFGDALVGDVTADAASGRVIVTGYAQRDGGACSQLQVAWIRAYDFSGALQWRAYDYNTRVADSHGSGDCADSRGRLVTIGEDGKLYFAGTSAGGNSIFRWQPQTRVSTTELISPTLAWPAAYNAKPGNDIFVDAYNTKSNHITYVARFNPANGAQEAGFFLLTRIDSKGNLGNTIEPRAISADREGRVLVGGFAAYQLDRRSSVSMNGTTLLPYAGEDAWLLITSPDYVSRETWVAFNHGGKATVRGIAVLRGAVAIGASVTLAPLFTHNALQPTAPSSTQRSGYVASFAMPAPPVASRCAFDIDASGSLDAAVDGLVLHRYLKGESSNALVAKTGVANANAAFTRAMLARSTFALDIDGNGVVAADSDGVMLLRALLGFKGAAITDGALGSPPASGSWRNTPALVEAYLAAQCVE